jgi:hypothetical protein
MIKRSSGLVGDWGAIGEPGKTFGCVDPTCVVPFMVGVGIGVPPAELVTFDGAIVEFVDAAVAELSVGVGAGFESPASC